MLDGLSEFETYRGVVKDAQELLKQHEQTMKQTDEAAAKPETMGKPLDALNPEQKGGARQSRRHGSRRSARACKTCWSGWARWLGRLNESDPLASSAMREAAEKTRQQGTTGKLGEAADQLEKNQMGKAQPRQEQARDELRDLVDAIQNRRERELSPAGQGAQERRGRAGQDPRQAGPEPEEDARGPAESRRQAACRAVETARQRAGRDPEGPEAATAKTGQAECRSGRQSGPDGQRQDGPRQGQPR